MPTNNSWLTPYQRSFNSIKQQVLNKLRTNVPEITDYTEGNILIVIISIFSAIAEVIHYYIDNVARETFFTTARRYSSLYKHAKLVDYHIKAGVPASTDLTLTFTDGKPAEKDITIPIGTQWVSKDGKVWVNTKSILWSAGFDGVTVPVVQKYEARSGVSLGTITYKGMAIQLTNIPADQFYVEGSMVLTIDGVAWTLVDTFAYAGPLDKVYKVELDESMVPTIYFGDNTNGMAPAINSKLTGSYYLTYGAASNIEADSFSSVPASVQSLDATHTMAIKQSAQASGGSDYEDFNALKRRVPLSLKTLGVAITKEDFENVAMLQDGVLKAYAKYLCGRYVQIFIVPDNYGVASSWLISQVNQKLQQAKVVTTAINVYPVYIGHLRFNLEVYGNKSFTSLEIKKQVTQALMDKFSWNNAELNTVIKVSDVYALIDNLPVVNYVNLKSMYLFAEPYLSVDNTGNLSPKLNLTFNVSHWNLNEALSFEVIFLTPDEDNESPYSLKINLSEELKELLANINAYQFRYSGGGLIDREFTEDYILLTYSSVSETERGFMMYSQESNGTKDWLGISWVLNQPTEGSYQPEDIYNFYISRPSAGNNLQTSFEIGDNTMMYLPVFTNESGDLNLEIHETI